MSQYDVYLNLIPESKKKKHTEINWRKFYGFRNSISHEYATVPQIVVMSLINELPNLKKAIIKIKGELK